MQQGADDAEAGMSSSRKWYTTEVSGHCMGLSPVGRIEKYNNQGQPVGNLPSQPAPHLGDLHSMSQPHRSLCVSVSPFHAKQYLK